jgi:RNA polymerase sigma factor (sigma-70 family)
VGHPDSREADPAVSAERADLATRLRQLLQDLPAPQRETIDLWCEGLTYRQIAEVTGRQEGHVRVLAHRGLTALRTHPLVRDLLLPDGHRPAEAAPHS